MANYSSVEYYLYCCDQYSKIMQFTQFTDSLHESNPSADLSVHLKALWYDKNDRWKEAHDLVDSLDDPDSALVHAYLHRVEGDLWNADYWYRKAGRKRPDATLEEEWEKLVQQFL